MAKRCCSNNRIPRSQWFFNVKVCFSTYQVCSGKWDWLLSFCGSATSPWGSQGYHSSQGDHSTVAKAETAKRMHRGPGMYGMCSPTSSLPLDISCAPLVPWALVTAGHCHGSAGHHEHLFLQLSTSLNGVREIKMEEVLFRLQKQESSPLTLLLTEQPGHSRDSMPACKHRSDAAL